MWRFFIFLIVMYVPFILSSKSQALSNVNDVKEIGFDEKLASTIDFDTEFYAENGKSVGISSFFGQKKPVVLSLAYFTCPRLCILGTDGVLEVVNQMDSFRPGRDYTLITVSFDPEESTDAIGTAATRYKKALTEGVGEAEGWHFLTATAENILRLTDSVGFRFKKDGEEFAHPSGMVILTPDGTISRYLYGVQHDPRNLKLSLIEASEGKIGSSEVLNKVLMFCYQFDPVGKRYALAALNVVKAGGVVTLTVLVAFLCLMWKRERKTH
ncbi:MAG: SCO family protein [Candidatus Dadabacteria bacterium]|nr:SCO family protein [Candidatus Dadabacteria bacterium]